LRMANVSAILGRVSERNSVTICLESEGMEKQNTSMAIDLQTVSSEDGDDPASRRWLAGERDFNSHNLFLHLRKAS